MKGKRAKQKSAFSIAEVSVERRSMANSLQSSTVDTNGYRDSIDAENHRDLEFQQGEGYDDDCDVVSDVTVITRAVDVAAQRRQKEVERALTNSMWRRRLVNAILPCIVLMVCIVAISISFGRQGNDGGAGFASPISNNEDGAGSAGVPTEYSISDAKIVEFTVANLADCTRSEQAAALNCIPSHNATHSTGKFRIRLRRDWAPLGAERFEILTTSKFWNDVRIFRIIPDFVSQFGLSGDADVQAGWENLGPIMDDPVRVSNTLGTVTFATSGENTRTVSGDM